MKLTLGEMKEMFDKVDDDVILDKGISEPFSWRGSYDEVCFSVEYRVSGKECKERIQMAYEETFHGYKGGEYRYNDFTPVNFESSSSSCTEQGYVMEMLDLEEESLESQLVKQMINS